MQQHHTIDQYIATFPAPVQALLAQMRAAIRRAAPEAEEAIRYGIPTFVLKGNLVHFGGFKKHIGFYPGASGVGAFKTELAAFAGAKGSVQFPIGQPLPLGLVEKIVRYRVQENFEKAAGKKTKTSSS